MENELEAHRAGSTDFWIDWFSVAPDRRGQGEGRRMYERFEAELPDDVTMVRVFAADTDGEGNSDAFWLALGFTYRYDAEDAGDLSYEQAHMLVKGVNGHAAPAPIYIEYVEEES